MTDQPLDPVRDRLLEVRRMHDTLADSIGLSIGDTGLSLRAKENFTAALDEFRAAVVAAERERWEAEVRAIVENAKRYDPFKQLGPNDRAMHHVPDGEWVIRRDLLAALAALAEGTR